METEERNLSALSDSMLLDRAVEGDAASFDALFYRHYDRVYGLIFRLVGERAEAEDLTQEVFVRLYRYAGDRRRAFRRGDREENLSAWLYRVATNLGYNALRSRRRLLHRNAFLVPADDEPAAERAVETREERLRVRAALARLPERQTQLLVLRQMGFSYAELAAVCGVAPGSVGALLARAAEAFRRAYAEAEGGER